MSDPSGVNTAGSAMPESSVGMVLQRGGEELILEKVSDRFTISTHDPNTLASLVRQLPAGVQVKQLPTEQAEVVIHPSQRDAMMAQVRSADTVKYASHVYQLQDNPGTQVYLTDEITIQFAPEVPPATIQQLTLAMGLRQQQPVLGIPNTFVFEVTAAAIENPLKIANRLMQHREVLTAEPNILVHSQSLYRPRDPIYPKQWHLHHNGGNDLAPNSHVFAELAWDITKGHRAVVVAIADDSVDLSHPDFQGVGKIVAPRDFYDRDFLPDPELPDDNHGTACAGVAVAEENGTGAVGIAPGCALMPLRTSGYLDDGSIEELFNWAIEKGAWVISCSWGASAVYFPLSLRQRAVITRAATEGRNGKGCVIVFAAGNANRPVNGSINERGWRNNVLNGNTAWLGGFAAHPDVIAVSASTSLNKKAAYSNWGAEISVCAPSNNAHPGVGLQSVGYVYTGPEIRQSFRGLGIVTTDRVGREGYATGDFANDFGGTSSACPLVAGVAALVLSANPDLKAGEVRQILQQTADKIVDSEPDPQLGLQRGTYAAGGRCDWFGYGKVNAFRAVQAARQKIAKAIAPTRQVQGQNRNPTTIPDANSSGVFSAIPISDRLPLRDIRLSVDITHSYMGDLTVSLIAPNGDRILLQGRTLGRQEKLQATYTVETTPLLRRLLNQPVNGNWQLWVVDHAIGDTGILNNWQLVLGL